MDTNFKSILNQIDPISLEEMDVIKLMNRQDTKYVFNQAQLPAILSKLKEHYRVLEIDGLREMTYGNVYFDTKDFRFYNLHHNGKLNRYKIRNRAYVESDLAFCELKFKSNKKRTEKQRTRIEKLEKEMNDETASFLQDIAPVPTSELLPKLFMDFNRITLAHKGFEDRCTIDFNLRAYNDSNSFEFENVVIAEIKQQKFSAASAFNQILKSEKIYPMGFSKYCIGMANVYPELKRNRFKPKLLKLKKIMHGAT